MGCCFGQEDITEKYHPLVAPRLHLCGRCGSQFHCRTPGPECHCYDELYNDSTTYYYCKCLLDKKKGCNNR